MPAYASSGPRGAQSRTTIGASRSRAQHAWDAGLGAGGADNGAQFSAAGSFRGALDQADAEKQKAFIASITGKAFHNQALQGAESALSAMLIRNAAYAGTPMTWDELLASSEVYDPKLNLARMS